MFRDMQRDELLGTVDIAQLKEFFMKMGVNATDAEIEDVFSQADLNGDGFIDEYELCQTRSGQPAPQEMSLLGKFGQKIKNGLTNIKKKMKCSSLNPNSIKSAALFRSMFDTTYDRQIYATEMAAVGGWDSRDINFEFNQMGAATWGQISYQEVCAYFDQFFV